uniref:Uncharacterized protein n=1 Tax=Bursaphelenchus xylophilus TaxID=6326 RepID=A0A1I7SS17_BURXY
MDVKRKPKKKENSEKKKSNIDRSFNDSPVFAIHMSRLKHADDILNVNVGGKRYTEAVKRIRETSVPETIDLHNSAYEEWDNL